jgi:hypothetical protein
MSGNFCSFVIRLYPAVLCNQNSLFLKINSSVFDAIPTYNSHMNVVLQGDK